MAKRLVVAVTTVLLLVPATAEAAFPGANGKIAFVRAGDIWTMNPDGTGQVNLTNSAADESSPTWSPDGNRIAFDSNGGSGSERQLYIMFADGTGVTQITFPLPPGEGNASRGDPAWSPDGDKLVFVQQFGPHVATINPDGTGETTVFFGDDLYDPEWSPDGTKIAFTNEGADCVYGIATVNPDGSDYAPVTDCVGDWLVAQFPTWSPDGQRIAYSSDEGCGFCGPYHLSTIDPDGTDGDSTSTVAYEPAWSPNGTKIVYSDGAGLTPRIKIANPDGTGVVDITEGYSPDWQRLNAAGPEADVLSAITDAPDPIPTGGILTYSVSAKNLVGPDDATGVTLTVDLPASVFFVSATPTQGSCSQAAGTVTCNLGNLAVGSSADVSIQVEPQVNGTITANANVSATEGDPVPGNNASSATTTISLGGFPRPKGADIIRASLVPAYRACEPDQASLTHGPPLDAPSCAAPALTSGHLTVGTPDANGAPANSIGALRVIALFEGPPIDPDNGDQADVRYDLAMTDVRNASDLSDYTGELTAQATLRITDRENTPSMNAPATVQDTSISFTAPCAATANTSTGGVCSISTTAEALIPGMIDERKRTIWELGRLRVFDGGADGDADTGPNTLFAVQGVFVP